MRPLMLPVRAAARRHAAVPRGQPDDALTDVVVLVLLDQLAGRIGAVHEGEAAAQARDADPVLMVGRGVDVGPAGGDAQAQLAAAEVLAAGGGEAGARGGGVGGDAPGGGPGGGG